MLEIEAIVSIKKFKIAILHPQLSLTTEPLQILHVWVTPSNNYFTSIAGKTKSNTKFSPKHTDYLPI